jgi:hypothetical protein
VGRQNSSSSESRCYHEGAPNLLDPGHKEGSGAARSSQLSTLEHPCHRIGHYSSDVEPQSSRFDVQMNAALVSLTLLLSTAFELVGLHIWQDASELLCGLWIAASPYAYAEVGELRYWHLSLGAALAALATINIWKVAKRVQRK